MLGMQDQTGIHDLGMVGIGFSPLQHVEEILRRGQIVPWRDRVIALADMLPHCHDHRDTGDQFHRHAVDIVQILANTGTGQTFIGRVEHPQTGHRGLQHLHRMAAGGQTFHHLANVELDPAVAPQQGIEVFQCGRGGKLPIQQQQSGFFKGAMFRQLLNRVATIGQDTLITIDEGDVRASGRHPFQTGQISAHALTSIHKSRQWGCILSVCTAACHFV